MKLPKEFVSNGTMSGGDLDDENTSTQGNSVVSTSLLTRKTVKDASKWCIENGFRPNIFVNSRDSKNWDKVRNDAYKIDKTLMEIVQPAKLLYKNHKDYVNDGGLMNKSDLKKSIKISKKTMNTIDPENKIKIKDINMSSYANEASVNGGYIIYGGFQNKSYEVNFFQMQFYQIIRRLIY